MSIYYEVPFETSNSFSTKFPPQLSKVIDQLTYIQSIETLNQSIQSASYNLTFKCLVVLSLLASCYFTIDQWTNQSINPPINQSNSQSINQFSFEYSIVCLIAAPILYLIGSVYQSYERRKPLQSALESINATINQCNNQSINPYISFRLYNPPLKTDRLSCGIECHDNSVDSYSEVVHIGNVSLFAGRSLYVEVAYPINQSNNQSTDQTIDQIQLPSSVPSVIAVDIPIKLSILGSCFDCDYDCIYPAPIAHIVDQTTFTDIITRINSSMHAVTINRWMLCIAVCLLTSSLPMLYDMRVDRYSAIAMVGVALFASGTLIVCYTCLSHMSRIVDASKQAVDAMNCELAQQTPRMQILPLGGPNTMGVLHGSNMHFDYAFKANELMLVVGQSNNKDNRLIDIQ